MKTRFTSPVVPGEEVAVSGTVKRIRKIDGREFVECDVAVTRPDGDKALNGSASIPLA